MGFHLTLSDDDRRLVDAIRLTPEEVFGRPYAGYLLVLIGAADIAALEWLRTHLVPLDSLTGEHVAFAVFAEKIPLQLEVFHGIADQTRQGRFLGDVPFTELRRLDSYIKAGNWGFVAAGDYLNAMTYATDRVARAFGVLDSLPCMLVIDAFAAEHVGVIELNDAQLPELLPVLRATMHRLTQDPKFETFNDALKILGNFQHRRDQINFCVSEEKRLLSDIPVSGNIERSVRLFHEALLGSIRTGSYREFSIQLRGIKEYAGDAVLNELDQNAVQGFVGLGKTIAGLSYFRDRDAPLSKADRARWRGLLTRAASLLPKGSTLSDETGTDRVRDLYESLVERQSVLIQQIEGSLPSVFDLTQRAKDFYQRQSGVIEDKLETLGLELNHLREKSQEAFRLCTADDSPSLSETMRKVAQEKKFKLKAATIRDKAVAYAGKLLEPQNIAKMIGRAMSA